MKQAILALSLLVLPSQDTTMQVIPAPRAARRKKRLTLAACAIAGLLGCFPGASNAHEEFLP
jgi:hypothetical protein